MSLTGIVVGFFMGLLPLIIILKLLKGRPAFIASPYLKGALSGFLLWLAMAVVLYLDALLDFAGLMAGDNGPVYISLMYTSHFGFITAGIVVAAMLEWRNPA